MLPSEKPTDYHSQLSQICGQLFKGGVSLEDGLSTFKAYVTSDKGWFSDKPFIETIKYQQIRRQERTALTHGLEELDATKKKQKVNLLSLDAVVNVAYKQPDPFDRQALLLLGHEFEFYTISGSSNSEYALGNDPKQNIPSLIAKIEQAKAENITSDALMAYLLPQQGPATIEMSTASPKGAADLDLDTSDPDAAEDESLSSYAAVQIPASQKRGTSPTLDPLNTLDSRELNETEEVGLAVMLDGFEEDPATASTVDMQRDTPAVLDPLYTLGINAILAGDAAVIQNIMRFNSTQLRGTQYRKHIPLAIQAANEQQNKRVVQAIKFYEESIDVTLDNEKNDPLYAHSLKTIFEIYSTSHTYTARIPKIYALAEEAKVALDTNKINERVASFSSEVLAAYIREPSLERIQQLDALLPLAQIPAVSATLTNGYMQLMRQALTAKNVLEAKHCSDTLTKISEAVPESGAPEQIPQSIEEIQQSIEDMLVLNYQFAALQYEVGAYSEAAEALEKCSRITKTGGAGALHLLTAKIRFAQFNNDAALASLEAAVTADFSDPRYKAQKSEALSPLYVLGMIYHNIGKTTEAEKTFQLAHTLNPTFASKDYTDATELFDRKEYTKTLTVLGYAAIVATYFSEAPRQDILRLLNTVGIVFKDGKEVEKNLDSAKQAFSASLTLEPTHVDAHYHLGTIAMMEKENALAVDHLKQVVEQNPRHSWGQYQLGLAYQRACEETLSQQHLHVAAELGHKQAQTLLK